MHTSIIEQIIAELQQLVANLGANGGLVSPSVYETAQVLRMAPPSGDITPALDWLYSQQRPDGGWGDLTLPHARDVPTLSAMLALQQLDRRPNARSAIQAGCAFLWRHAACWSGGLPEHLPVAVELILPYLISEATQAGLDVPQAPYARLIEFGARRRWLLKQATIRGGSTAAHSWEAFGVTPDPLLIDAADGVSHSPAATAAWIRAAKGDAALRGLRDRAQSYLERCSAATGLGIPGVVPGLWPFVRFEQVFVLYILYISGLFDHPALREVVSSQVANVAGALRPGGLGLSDYFAPDGDDTAAALVILRTAGYPVDLGPLRPFTHHDHFWAYPGELHGSVSLTARCISARALFRVENSPYLHYILERQQPDGRWLNDKWHSSWIYTTCHAIIALRDSKYSAALRDAVNGLVEHQQPDGGWGTREETGFAIFALRAARHVLYDQAAAAALGRAEEWMLSHHRRFHSDETTAWIGKELYRPQRIVRAIELAASIPGSHLSALPGDARALRACQRGHH